MVKNNIEWVLSDLDGTLLRYENGEHIVEDDAIRAIEKLVAKNVTFTIATGRKHSDVINFINKYDLADKTKYIIACNGAIIYDLEKNEIIQNNFLTKSVKTKVMKAIDEFKKETKKDCIVLSYDVNNNIYLYDKDKKFDKKTIEELFLYEGEFSANNYIEIDDLNAHDDLIKLIFFFNRKTMKETINDYLAKFISLTKLDSSDCIAVSPMSFELNSANTSKGNAILQLNKILKKDLKKTMSIGDSFNDISMFQVTGVSVSLESSHKEVQNNATNILDAKASQVVADAIELFVL
ncbi:Cof-type HAD-IIB family hydrolase [Mycoplasma sp. E35C]|uniref:Cof-type HAD-IIB family hydrolase n=1 Tax=Mycoplasma sp. E35C TaxID=2801918 RepID=UPI001CA438AC|nr:Cof-type HAD-IIB family hydrolase [Mycoplasma sp. E35C]QZX49055.1 Cof-type HAD-IIB family hydrolase [Mycoplasma sp. E35C]